MSPTLIEAVLRFLVAMLGVWESASTSAIKIAIGLLQSSRRASSELWSMHAGSRL